MTVAAALMLPACGGDDNATGHDHGETTATVAGAREVTVRASNYTFDPSEITVRTGEPVTIVLISEDGLHDFTVESAHVSATKGQTARGGLKIDTPGKHTFYCSVPGHRAQGMKGTIVAEPTASNEHH